MVASVDSADSTSFDELFVSDAEYEAIISSKACSKSGHYQGPRCVLPLCEVFLQEHQDTVMRIDDDRLAALTDGLSDAFLAELPEQDAQGLCAQSSPSSDSAVEDKFCQLARILAYNVMNFSFFPDEGRAPWHIEGGIGKDDEAFAIVESLKRWEKSGHYGRWLKKRGSGGAAERQAKAICWLDGTYMKSLTRADLQLLFQAAPEAGELPLLDLRLKCLHSLADGLYGDSTEDNSLELFLATCLLEPNPAIKPAAGQGYSAALFVRELCRRVPAFRDVRRWSRDVKEAPEQTKLEIAKRPQLTVGMLHGDGIVRFADMDQLTVFSDYRLPQLFRSKGVFKLQGGKDEGALPVLAHSALEIALRVGTLVAAERMRQRLMEKAGRPISAADLDYFLWKTTVALDNKGELQPFHRTRTFAY